MVLQEAIRQREEMTLMNDIDIRSMTLLYYTHKISMRVQS